jgi:hypothetical protein
VISATPTIGDVISLDDVISLIDAGVFEFKNQKLCDSHRVTDVLLDIRNLVSNIKIESIRDN